MKTKDIFEAVKAAGGKHGATVLTVLAALGVVATAYLTNKARPDADERVQRAKEDKAIKEAEEKGENPDFDHIELTTVEKIKAAAPAYVKVFVVAGLTIIFIVGSRVISVRQMGDLAAAYNIIQTVEEKTIKYGEKYEEKVKEIIGEEKNEEVKKEVNQEIAQERKDYFESKGEDWLSGQIARAAHTGHGNTLIYDPYTDRFYYSDPIYLKEVAVDIAKRALDGCYSGLGMVSLNDFYEEADIHTTKAGEHLFWDMTDKDERINPTFTPGSEILDGRYMYMEMKFEDEPKGYAGTRRFYV